MNLKNSIVVLVLAGVALAETKPIKQRLKDTLVSVVPDEDLSIWESFPEKTDSVNVQLLDKISGKVFRSKLKVDQTTEFGSIVITIKNAFVNSPEDMDEVYAYVEIKEKGETIFSNWLFASSPSINLFMHPVYDVRIEF